MGGIRQSRRNLLRTGVGVAALAGCGGLARPAYAQEIDWKQFDGESIEVLLIKSPRGDVLQKYQSEFEELTGITVGAEQVPEQQQRQKVVIEFNSGQPSFDVAHLSYHVQKRLFERGKWLLDLREYLGNPQMTPAEYRFEDNSEAGRIYATDRDGAITSLPWSVDYWMIYWNQELFQAKGLPFPKTYDELLAAAEALTDKANGVAGFVSRGLKNANTPVWNGFMLGNGQEPIGPGSQLNTTGPEAIAAAQLYQKLNRDYGAPGVSGYNWNECQTTFMQGKAAMWMDGIGFAPPLEDPKRSRVVGKVGYGVMPAGPKAAVSGTYGDGIGVARASEKAGAAYLYCQWAVSRLMLERLLLAGGGVPFISQVVETVAQKGGFSLPQGWFDCVLGSSKISKLGLPVIVPVAEFRDIFGIALTNMIAGADPRPELEKASAEFKPILEKSEAS